MKNSLKTCALVLVLLLLVSLSALAAGEPVDYAASVSLNFASDTAKQEVSVAQFVDGDTTHFHVPESVDPSGILKARYLAINTPECTGKIEEYGKKAAEFTRSVLSEAESIVIESDNGRWNPDSTGSRTLVWVWYKTADSKTYRNLNIEILQNGLAIANSSANNRYGSTCMDAIAQAKAEKRCLYSGQKDPDFYYGEAIELTIKELRLNPEAYEGKKVAFTGVITANDGSCVFLEDFDPETGLYFGMPVYYGYGLNGKGLDILSVGNASRIVGTLQFYEAGGTWQISGLSYRQMKPKDPGNIQKISEGHEVSYLLTDPKHYAEGTVELETASGKEQFAYADLVQGTSVSMNHLEIRSAQLQEKQGGGPGTLMLKGLADGAEICMRVFLSGEDDRSALTAEKLVGGIIDVKGLAETVQGVPQIKVLTTEDIVFY